MGHHNGIRTRYLYCAAPGKPEAAVLLIHGLLGYSFSWRFNLAALSQQANVYAIDLPGTGFSERPRQMDRSASGLVRHLLQFMDAAGIGEADVVGTSHGGILAMLLAAAGRVSRLVLVAPVNPWSEHGGLLTRVLASAVGAGVLRALWPGAGLAHDWVLKRLYGDPRRIAPGTSKAYAAPLRIPGTLDHLRGIVSAWQADLCHLERSLNLAAGPSPLADTPTLLVWGSLDRAVLPQSATILRQHFRKAELVILEGVGHLPYEEAPETFNRVVEDFLGR